MFYLIVVCCYIKVIRRTSYDQIVAKEPSQKEFYNGWINRVIRLKKNVDNNVFNEDAEKIKIHDKNTVYINQLESEMFNYSKENESLLNTKSKQVIEEKFVLSDAKENLLKKLKSLIKKLQALFEEYQPNQENSETNNNPTNYVYEDRLNEQSKESQNTATEDDGLVIIPDKYKDKSNVSHYEVYSGKNGKHFIEVYKNNSRSYHITKDTPSSINRVTNTGARESVLAPKTKVSSANNIIPYIVPDVNQDSGNNLNNTQVLKGHVEKNVDYNNEYAAASEGNKEPEINPEYLKPIELEEDGMATGGAAGISDKFVNPNYSNRNSAKNFAEDEVSSPDNEIDFFKTSMKELMKHTKKFSYDANAGKLDSITLLNRKLDKINKNLVSM